MVLPYMQLYDFLLLPDVTYVFPPGSRQVAASAEKHARERELSKVQVSKEDVDLIAHEMDLAKTKADRVIREHGGDVVQALAALTN